MVGGGREGEALATCWVGWRGIGGAEEVRTDGS